MKHFLLTLFVSLGLFAAHAQDETVMMSGVLLDEYGKLLYGGIIRLTNAGETVEIKVSEDGMYYSPLLYPGSYRVDIFQGRTHYKGKRLHLYYEPDKKLYHNFKLNAERAELYTDEHDPMKRLKAGEHIPQSND